MREILPGVFHWTAFHEPFGAWLSSYDVAPGLTAIHIGKVSPDEAAFHVAVADGAIVFADGLIRSGDALEFFPDDSLGAHADRVREGLKDSLRGLLTRDFDHLLFAHGEPLVGGGKAPARDFLSRPVGHEDFGQAL